jgi:hypothetical protein
VAESQSNSRRKLIGLSVWLHVGHIGAIAVAAGALQMLDGKATTLSALTLACSGGALAVASWRRALHALEEADLPSFASDASASTQMSPGSTQWSTPWSPTPSND